MIMDWGEINKNRKLSCEKYDFYNGCYSYQDFGKGGISKSLPVPHVGWANRAVAMQANKTKFDCFENDTLGFTDIVQRYGIAKSLDKLKDDILVAGCGFIALVGDRVLPFAATEASGKYDWQTQNLSFGAAVFSKRSIDGTRFGATVPADYMIFEKDRTRIRRTGDKKETIVNNPTGRPLIGLLTHHATTRRPFGNSVIVRAARDAIVDASRTTRQAMISAYYYNSKVDVILGATPDMDIERVETQAGDILKLGPSQDGVIPQIGQFAQHAMTPFTDTILISARNFCTATKLTLANLGISSDAPQSPEALEIVSDDLRDDISAWHDEIGEQLKYFCMTLFMFEHGISKIDDNLRKQYQKITATWKPTYRVDVSKFGDGLFKIAEKAPGALLSRQLWRNIGLSSAEIDETIKSIKDNPNLWV